MPWGQESSRRLGGEEFNSTNSSKPSKLNSPWRSVWLVRIGVREGTRGLVVPWHTRDVLQKPSSASRLKVQHEATCGGHVFGDGSRGPPLSESCRVDFRSLSSAQRELRIRLWTSDTQTARTQEMRPWARRTGDRLSTFTLFRL